MQLIARKTIENYAATYADAADALSNWVAMVRSARWESPEQMIASSSFPTRVIGNGRVIFNIKGNHFRLICGIRYASAATGYPGILFVKFFGTHAEYDKIDALTVEPDL